MATATYVQAGNMVDYTPGSNVSAGDVIVQADLVGVAVDDIAANRKGALYVEGVFDVPKDTTSTSALAAGTIVYWNDAEDIVTSVAGILKRFGKVVIAAAAAAATVRVKLIP